LLEALGFTKEKKEKERAIGPHNVPYSGKLIIYREVL